MNAASLESVTKKPVVTKLVGRDVIAALCNFVATINSADHTVVTTWGRTNEASEYRIANLHAIAKLSVATGRVVGKVYACVASFVA